MDLYCSRFFCIYFLVGLTVRCSCTARLKKRRIPSLPLNFFLVGVCQGLHSTAVACLCGAIVLCVCVAYVIIEPFTPLNGLVVVVDAFYSCPVLFLSRNYVCVLKKNKTEMAQITNNRTTGCPRVCLSSSPSLLSMGGGTSSPRGFMLHLRVGRGGGGSSPD